MREILDRLERETGKARFDVVGELMGVCLDLGYLARRAPRWLAPEQVSTRPLFGKRALRRLSSRAASSASSARGTRR